MAAATGMSTRSHTCGHWHPKLRSLGLTRQAAGLACAVGTGAGAPESGRVRCQWRPRVLDSRGQCGVCAWKGACTLCGSPGPARAAGHGHGRAGSTGKESTVSPSDSGPGQGTEPPFPVPVPIHDLPGPGRGSGAGVPPPICRGSKVQPHHPRFAGDRGSSPSPVPIGGSESVPCQAQRARRGGPRGPGGPPALRRARYPERPAGMAGPAARTGSGSPAPAGPGERTRCVAQWRHSTCFSCARPGIAPAASPARGPIPPRPVSGPAQPTVPFPRTLRRRACRACACK
jgi:hypothetical protein